MLANACLSAALNVLLFAGIPFLAYFAYQRWRHQRGLAEIACRAGLQRGDLRYVGYSAVFALLSVAIILAWPMSMAPFSRDGSPQRAFVGLGLGLAGPAVPMALLYGVVKTGFSEELLFRGLIAGSLSRRMSMARANVLQSLIFLLPHALVIVIMPEMWGVLPLVFGGSLFLGWVRIRSGSILGPWLVHASANVAMCLVVAMRTAH